MRSKVVNVMMGLFVAVLFGLAGCGSGGSGGDTPGSASGSSVLKGTWVEQSATPVEGTIRFDELQVYRGARFGDYSLNGSTLTYTLTDYVSGLNGGRFVPPQSELDFQAA